MIRITKGTLVRLLEDIPDDYEVLIDGKKLWTVFANHEDEVVNLSSELLLQYVYAHNPLLPLTQFAFLHTNRQATM